MSALAIMTWIFCTGHTPYRQWAVHRQKHLFVVTSRTDGSSYELGKHVAEILATHLPASKARVTRAPNMERIGSLISTKQLDVALLSHSNAAAMLSGLPPFVEYGPVPLRTIIELGDYLLVCRDDFPARHAYLMVRTLSIHRAKLPSAFMTATQTVAKPTGEVPMHPGVSAYLEGRPPPQPKEESGDQ
ncbi:MAG: hypothetical protein KJP23_14770 [Deltaproteobacteria bacterium]|nr:hypothetical protein [Deltaproteobacteria bacterium]